MTTPPSHWPDKALHLAMTVMAVAVMLYLAAKLIVAVLPVLIGIGSVIFVIFVLHALYQFWRSRW